jgi:hypothetical protein
VLTRVWNLPTIAALSLAGLGIAAGVGLYRLGKWIEAEEIHGHVWDTHPRAGTTRCVVCGAFR